MTEWINRADALRMLGVKPQTLYAYVSRGLIEVQRDPSNAGRSLYRSEDVTTLANRRSRSRKPAAIAASSMAWGEASIVTEISTVQHGRLIYRGYDAAEVSKTMTLEETAALLWSSEAEISFKVADVPFDSPFQALASLIPASKASIGRSREHLCQDAMIAIGHIAAACGVPQTAPSLHAGLARHWSLDKSGEDLVREALVLMADHELNASTFAARVAASTGAPIAACLNAGLSALAGPLHGGAGPALTRLLEHTSTAGSRVAVQSLLNQHGVLPGFGHPLYPNGDVRAATLLSKIEPDSLMLELRACVQDITGAIPNIDFALTAIMRAFSFAEQSPPTLFLLGRSIGWAAHSIERVLTGALIRPRARYEGAMPN